MFDNAMDITKEVNVLTREVLDSLVGKTVRGTYSHKNTPGRAGVKVRQGTDNRIDGTVLEVKVAGTGNTLLCVLTPNRQNPGDRSTITDAMMARAANDPAYAATLPGVFQIRHYISDRIENLAVCRGNKWVVLIGRDVGKVDAPAVAAMVKNETDEKIQRVLDAAQRLGISVNKP